MEVEELVMQEEANQRTVGLVVTATKFTGRTFARAVDMVMYGIRQRRKLLTRLERCLKLRIFRFKLWAIHHFIFLEKKKIIRYR